MNSKQNSEVVIFNIGESLSDEDVKYHIDTISDKLNSTLRFGVIFIYKGKSPKKSKTSQLMENRWIKTNRILLKNQCYGLAMVANPSISSLLNKIVLKGLGTRLFGCRCNVFFSIEQASIWLKREDIEK